MAKTKIAKIEIPKKKAAKEIKIARDFVLLKPIAPIDKTPSGIEIVGGNKVGPKPCMVVKVGPGAYDKFNNFIEVPCKPGDVVMVAHGNTQVIELFDEEFLICSVSEVLVIIR